MKRIYKSPLVRRLAGAALGAGVALGVYAMYQSAEPKLGAIVHTFWKDEGKTGARFAQKRVDAGDRTLERQAQRNREISGHFASGEAPGRQAESTPFRRIAEKAQTYQGQITPDRAKGIIGNENEEEPVPSVEPPRQTSEPVPEDWQKDFEAMEKENFDGGKDLPDSGFGALTAAAMAGGITAAIGRRNRKKVH